MRYGIFTICTRSTSLPRKMAPKWRIVFLHVNIAQKTLHLVETAKLWRKSIALLAAYRPFTQFPESILSTLVALGLLWLQLSNIYRKFKSKRLNKGQITQNMKVFNVLEIVTLVI